MAVKLSKSQCILLAVKLAAESKPQAIRQLLRIPTARDLPSELILRILLTYLPGVTPAAQYVGLVEALTTPDDLVVDNDDDNDSKEELSVTSIGNLSNASATKKLKTLTLLPLSPPDWPADAPEDLLTRFICHRAYRIDEETGLVTNLPDLVRPFLRQSEYLRLWAISVLLPLLRLQHEYYQDTESERLSLEAFERIDGHHGTELLLSKSMDVSDSNDDLEVKENLARDLKGLVGPWIYGHTCRKRRRLDNKVDDTSKDANSTSHEIEKAACTWENVNSWLVQTASLDFAAVVSAIEEWDGPIDVDLGDFANSDELLSSDDERSYLGRRYAQAAIAACYVVDANTEEAVRGAHGILARLADLLDFVPPPDLATSVEQLPRVDRHMSEIHAADTVAILDADRLLDARHPLTDPTVASYMLLQMLIYSSYQLLNLGYPVSTANVAKLRFFSEEDDQLQVVKKILHGRSQNGKRDESEWKSDRAKLLWLWNWNIDPDEPAQRGSGPLGDISKEVLEREIVVSMLMTGNLHLVETLYVHSTDRTHRLSDDDLEEIIIGEAMRYYDNATNGNKQRGNMKKADDIAAFFTRLFPNSLPLARVSALFAATHSLSFYSLTLQHGVPFQPVNIRTSSDPLTLLELTLDQNPRSYTKLEDLISIGRSLAIAAPDSEMEKLPPYHDSGLSKHDVAKQAERRVIYMCISAALSAGDFDTAYSYLTSRLQPDFTLPPDSRDDEPQSTGQRPEDDISWRAAFLAGRTASPTQPPHLEARIRRLEQRTELLSLALLLGPVSALTEILGVYRRVEEEMTALLAQQAADEAEHDSVLDRQRAGQAAAASSLPGGFGAGGGDVFEGRTFNQTTRTVGNFSRGYNSTESAVRPGGGNAVRTRDNEAEAPVGLFDLARGAASALGRNAFPLRGAAAATTAAGAAGASGQKETVKPRAPEQKGVVEAKGGEDEGDDWAAWGEEGEPTAQPTGALEVGNEEEEAWGWTEGSPRPGSSGTNGWGTSSFHSDGSGTEGRASGERVRRRDMVANAVTGGLASGIGWVLGATPVEQQEKDRREGSQS